MPGARRRTRRTPARRSAAPGGVCQRSIAATASSSPQGSERIHSSRSGQTSSGATSATGAGGAGGGSLEPHQQVAAGLRAGRREPGCESGADRLVEHLDGGRGREALLDRDGDLAGVQAGGVASTRTTLTSRTNGTRE